MNFFAIWSSGVIMPKFNKSANIYGIANVGVVICQIFSDINAINDISIINILFNQNKFKHFKLLRRRSDKVFFNSLSSLLSP